MSVINIDLRHLTKIFLFPITARLVFERRPIHFFIFSSWKIMDICSNFLDIAHELLSKTFTTTVTTQHRNMVATCEGLEGLNDVKNYIIK